MDESSMRQAVLDIRAECPRCGTVLVCRNCSKGSIPTPMELKIVRELWKDGGSNKDIAERLGIADSTVKTHIRSLMTKARVNNRAGLLPYGFRQGWLY